MISIKADTRYGKRKVNNDFLKKLKFRTRLFRTFHVKNNLDNLNILVDTRKPDYTYIENIILY